MGQGDGQGQLVRLCNLRVALLAVESGLSPSGTPAAGVKVALMFGCTNSSAKLQ